MNGPLDFAVSPLIALDGSFLPFYIIMEKNNSNARRAAIYTGALLKGLRYGLLKVLGVVVVPSSLLSAICK